MGADNPGTSRRRRRALRLAAVLGAAFLGSAPAAAQEAAGTIRRDPLGSLGIGTEIDLGAPSLERYALVIGNADYAHAPDLSNAGADARLVADLLRRNGYVVSEAHDLTKRGFEAELRAMLRELGDGAEFVFFYAGHGVQIGGGNYLLPVDAEIGTVYDVPFEAISLSSVMALAGARARSVVAVIDSCRDNPFPEQLAVVQVDGTPQALRTGFTPQESPVNSLVVFSTSPGAVAFDGEAAGNGPFAEAFVEVASASPGEPIDLLLREIRRRVYEATDGRQLPWDSSSLVEPVALTGLAPAWPEGAPREGEAGGEAQGEAIRVTGDLDRRVELGSQLPEGAIGLHEEPARGRVVVRQDGRFLSLPGGASLGGEGPMEVFYAPVIEEAAARDLGPDRGITDRFVLNLDGRLQAVDLALDVDPCDFEAGDVLDPQGVGVARYPNEIEPEAARAACEAAVAAHPGTGRFPYQLGRAFLAVGDLDAAEGAFRQAQDLGHVRAWHGLGLVAMARAGDAAERAAAPEEALALFAEGARRGDPYAFHALGLQLLLYPRSIEERREGFALLSRALELGHTFSMNALGLYFLEEGSDHYTPERGLRYLAESAERGDIYGYANMGFVALTGAGGTEPDLEAALDWFRRASDEGHPTAPTSIGRMVNAGQVPGGRDPAEAVRWYDLGLERGDPWGGANAAWIIANDRPAGFEPWDAAVRAAKAAALADPEAAAAAGEVLASLPHAALDGGSQSLMGALGEPVEVDGDWGAGSRDALARLEAARGLDLPDEPGERLGALARLWWEETDLRADLRGRRVGTGPATE